MPIGKEVGLRPDHILLDGDSVGTQRPPQQPLPTFRPMSIVAKRSPISATAELLLQINSSGQVGLTHHSYKARIVDIIIHDRWVAFFL